MTLLACTGTIQATVTEATPCRDSVAPPPAACSLSVTGNITARDEFVLAGILHRADLARTLLLVRFDSGGGDAHAAMALGRALRAASAHGYVPSRKRCLSACVLALAGAKTRAAHGRIGIHRPTHADAARLSAAETRRRDEETRQEIREYLSEMGIAPALYDAMYTVPPDKMRMLTRSELQLFGLLPGASPRARPGGA